MAQYCDAREAKIPDSDRSSVNCPRYIINELIELRKKVSALKGDVKYEKKEKAYWEERFSKLEKQLNESSAGSTRENTLSDQSGGPGDEYEQRWDSVPADKPASIRNSTLIDNSIIIDFAKNVLPTKSGLELSIHKSSDNSLVETINFNSSTPDGLVSFETRIEDYSHNTVALGLNDFTDELASEYGVKAGSQTGDYWVSKLRDEWLLVIDGQSYEAKAKSSWTTDTDWSYHELTPEYTPGQDLSGTKEILLSPKAGIKQLIISPKTSLSFDTDYYLEIENGDFKIQSTGMDLAAYKLNFDLGSSPTKSKAGTKNPKSGSTQDQQQEFTLELPSKFNNKLADKITNFNPSEETLYIDSDSFAIGNSMTFKAGKNYKKIKELANIDCDFLYDQNKGRLYFNENGADKGFGDGGIIAIIKGAPDLTIFNIDLI